jgi:hypothetical protein
MPIISYAPNTETTKLTFATASKGPETLRIRSGFPGIDSDTVTLAFDLSYPVSFALMDWVRKLTLISLTWAPARPIITLASPVTIKLLIWIF